MLTFKRRYLSEITGFELRRQAWQASLKMQREETKDAAKTTTSTAYLSRALAVKTITNSHGSLRNQCISYFMSMFIFHSSRSRVLMVLEIVSLLFTYVNVQLDIL